MSGVLKKGEKDEIESVEGEKGVRGLRREGEKEWSVKNERMVLECEERGMI